MSKLKKPELVQELLSTIETSPFYISPNYQITTGFHTYFNDLLMYHYELDGKGVSNKALLLAMTPEFQRQNTKWSQVIQIQFIENLVSGCKSTLLMYCIGQNSDPDYSTSFILDGLQRNTAIEAFINGDFPIFGKFYFEDVNSRRAFGNCRLSLQFYVFPTHRAACKHYIAMNKGITHSPEDLVTAYRYLELNSE